MKNKQCSSALSVLFFLLTLALVLFSWIGSVYGVGEVQSLLSAEGIRWVLGHVVGNYVQCPALGMALVLYMGLGIGVRSGLYGVLMRLFRREKQLSRKERRASALASVTFVMYLALVGVSVWLPWNFLLGATGSWLHSPLAKGFVYILSVGIGLSGMVYGYVSDAFRRVADVVAGMSSLIASRASGFVSLFFVVQFFSSLTYTRLSEWVGISPDVVQGLYVVSCLFAVLDVRFLVK